MKSLLIAEPDRRSCDAYGWSDHGYCAEFGHHSRNRLTCNEARLLAGRRFDHIRLRECNCRTDRFRAVMRNGNRMIVYVESKAGAFQRG